MIAGLDDVRIQLVTGDPDLCGALEACEAGREQRGAHIGTRSV